MGGQEASERDASQREGESFSISLARHSSSSFSKSRHRQRVGCGRGGLGIGAWRRHVGGTLLERRGQGCGSQFWFRTSKSSHWRNTSFARGFSEETWVRSCPCQIISLCMKLDRSISWTDNGREEVPPGIEAI